MCKLYSTDPCDRPLEGIYEQQSTLRNHVSTKVRNFSSMRSATIRFSPTSLYGITKLYLQILRLSYRKGMQYLNKYKHKHHVQIRQNLA